MPYTTHTYTRAKLFEEVWAEPMRTVARRYGVSDVALEKICRKLCVPLPGAGHWAKKAAGKRVRGQPPLPPAPPGMAEELTARRWQHEPGAIRSRGVAGATEPPIAVLPALQDPHPLVAAAFRRLSQARAGL